MKIVAFISSLFLAAVFAALVEKDINALIERADKLVNESNHLIAEHKNNSRGHLLAPLQFEVRHVEKVAQDLKQLAASNLTHRTSKLNDLEARLVYLENRLQEEEEFVEDVYKNYNATNKSADELIQYGERLVALGKKALHDHHGHGHAEDAAIHAEVFEIQILLNGLRHHSLPLVTALEEEALVLHERSLHRLIERLESHHHH